jgi:hypothetical protein
MLLEGFFFCGYHIKKQRFCEWMFSGYFARGRFPFFFFFIAQKNKEFCNLQNLSILSTRTTKKIAF